MVVWHLADVSLNPSVNALPGGGTLQDLTNGLGAWALIAALAGLLIGAGAWALGVHAQNFQQSMVGKRAVLVSGLAALLIGAAPPLINFFFHTVGVSFRLFHVGWFLVFGIEVRTNVVYLPCLHIFSCRYS